MIPPGGVSPAIPVPAVVAGVLYDGGLADDIDPKTGELRSMAGKDPTDDAVLFQLTVKRGSGAAVLEDGQRFEDVKKNDEGAPAALKFEAQRALRVLVERGDVEIESLEVEAGPDKGDLGAVALSVKNLRTGRSAPLKVTP